MDTSLLLPEEFSLRYSDLSKNTVILGLMSRSLLGYCPLCQAVSSQVHSYYERTVSDLPISGKRVSLCIRVRRFFCQQAACPRKVFAERFGSCLKPYQRRLERTNQQIQTIGLMIGGKPTEKIARVIGLPVSASTVLRVLRKTALPVETAPTAVGVDDFAFKKGHTYGTILVDLQRRAPIDLLPDREGKTLEVWLQAHAGIQILTRDRSSVYAAAMTAACPQAVQVADRWHLLKNLSENLERLLDSQRTLINQAAQEVNQSLTPPAQEPLIISTEIMQLPVEAIPTEKRYDKYRQVKQLQQDGHPMRTIARHLGMSRRTVKKYFTQESFTPKTKTKRANLLEFERYLRQCWQAGETNGKSLLKEIKQLGYTGSYTILMNLLASYPKTASESALPAAQKGLMYSSRSLSIAFCQAESEWDEEKRPLLTKLLENSPLLQQARELSLEFKTLMTQKKGQELENWCQKASQLSAFTGFVRGIRQDFAAVEQALTSPWSNGQTEGQVNRLKNIKRQMYGRAGFDLLRLRVLARAA